jgi:hypothetical protein
MLISIFDTSVTSQWKRLPLTTVPFGNAVAPPYSFVAVPQYVGGPPGGAQPLCTWS